jgi:hypothetical protein
MEPDIGAIEQAAGEQGIYVRPVDLMLWFALETG